MLDPHAMIHLAHGEIPFLFRTEKGVSGMSGRWQPTALGANQTLDR
jgi:hypothetical protein